MAITTTKKTNKTITNHKSQIPNQINHKTPNFLPKTLNHELSVSPNTPRSPPFFLSFLGPLVTPQSARVWFLDLCLLQSDLSVFTL